MFYKKLLGIMMVSVLAIGVCACGEQDGPVNRKEGKENSTESGKNGSGSGVVGDSDPEEKTSEDLYNDFINMEISAWFNQYGPTDDDTAPMNIAQLARKTKSAFCENWCDGEAAVDKINYSIIDAGMDGEPELAIQVILRSEYNGEVTDQYVIKNFDGELKCVAHNEGAYRSCVSMNKYGVIYDGGSGGAASWYDGYNAVCSDGVERHLYSVETESAYGDPVVPSYYLDNVPSDYPTNYWDMSGENIMYIYTFRDDAELDSDYTYYYVFTTDRGEQLMPSDKLMEVYRDNGINVVTVEEIDGIIDERIKSLGFTIEQVESNEIEYKVLSKEATADVFGNDWKAAYAEFLSDNYNFSFILSEPYSISGMAWDYICLTGYSVAEVNNDGVPELLLIGQDGYDEGEIIFGFEYNEDKKSVEYLGNLSIQTSSVGMYSWYINYISDDSFILSVANNHLCCFGTYKGETVRFLNWGDESINFYMLVDDFSVMDGDKFFSEEYYYDFENDSGWKKYGEMSNPEEAKEILENYTPVMFYAFDDVNAKEMLANGSIVEDAISHSDEEIVQMFKRGNDLQRSIDVDSLYYTGIIGEDYYAYYDVENLIQWFDYNAFGY